MAATAEIGAWAVERYRLPVLPINVLASGGPTLAAAVVFSALAPADDHAAAFYALLAAVGCGALILNVLILTTFMGPVNGIAFAPRLAILRGMVPTLLITLALT